MQYLVSLSTKNSPGFILNSPEAWEGENKILLLQIKSWETFWFICSNSQLQCNNQSNPVEIRGGLSGLFNLMSKIDQKLTIQQHTIEFQNNNTNNHPQNNIMTK